MKSYLSLVGALVLMLLTLLFATQRYILSSYYALEASQNERIVMALLQGVHAQTDFVKKTLKDYAEWDDTFAFIETKSSAYVHANFRENSHTLEGLDVCALVFLDLERTLVLPVFSSRLSSPKAAVREMLAGSQEFSKGFLLLEEEVYFYDEHPINNSEGSAVSNGWLLALGKLDIPALLSQNPELINIGLLPSFETKGVPQRYSMVGRGIDVMTHWQPNGVENFIILGRHSTGEAYGLHTVHSREMLAQGKQALYLFLLVASSMAAMIFLLIFFRQKEVQREKIKLKEIVALRTQALQNTTQELEQVVKKLEQIAYVDELTGVQTRRSFFETIHPLLSQAAKEEKTVCVALIDLDDFKLINDTYGHAAGDVVLQHFCDACREFLDERMLFARIGGEEFVISFYDMSLKKAEKICLQIQHYVGETPVSIDARTHVSYTFSLGIADNSVSRTIDHILREADERLYSAKSLGKNIIRSRN
ncbi:MAG: diguanylate cyclase [Campylobacterales bacterium]|nr:diguanylate cyclase [Campylobacterales bacterium]